MAGQHAREDFPEFFGMSEPEKKRGSSFVPTKFTPPEERLRGLPKLCPGVVFGPRPGPVNDFRERFIGYVQPQAALFYSDGACLNDGQPEARAGWAVFFGPEPEARTISGRLERRGPFDDVSEQTSNRAELRAAIAGLRCIPWHEDGYNQIVIASDSEYLVEGATVWVRRWMMNGWKTSKGCAVKNQDLWELLLGEVERYHDLGVKVELWKIAQEWNEIADRWAKRAALGKPDEEEFIDIMVPGI